MSRHELLWSVVNDQAGTRIEIQTEEQQVVGTGLGLPECRTAANARGFDLDRAPVGGYAVNAGVRTGIDEPKIKELGSNGLTQVADQVSIQRELETDGFVVLAQAIAGGNEIGDGGR